MTDNPSMKKCNPCENGTSPIEMGEIHKRLERLDKGWKAIDGRHIEKEFTFEDFKEALSFTNKVGDAAEKVGHHPEIRLRWGKVKLEMYSHEADGLTENDFILASRADAIRKAGRWARGGNTTPAKKSTVWKQGE